jgi:hypothetical protein
MTSRSLPLFALLLLAPCVAGAQAPAPATSAALAASAPVLTLKTPAPVSPAAPATAGTLPATLGAATPAPTSLTALAPAASSDDLGATEVRQASKIKAQIDLEKLRTGLQQAQFERQLAAKKFTDDMSKSDKDTKGKDSAASGNATVVPVIHPRPYATSVYQFGDNSYAQVVIDGARYMAVPGQLLPNGAKVLSVGSGGVILRQNGQKVTVPVVGGGVPWSASQP